MIRTRMCTLANYDLLAQHIIEPAEFSADFALDVRRGETFRWFLNRSRGVKSRSQISPTWFSTCPPPAIQHASHVGILGRLRPSPSPMPECRGPARRGSGCTSEGSGDCKGVACRRRSSPPPSSCYGMDASRFSATIVARGRRKACHLTYLQLILGSDRSTSTASTAMA